MRSMLKGVGLIIIGILLLFTGFWLYQNYDRLVKNKNDKQKAAEEAARDSVARATLAADTAQLLVDSVVPEFRDRWYALPRQVDTVKIPVPVREAMRSCVAAVDALETSCERKDRLIEALRVEVGVLEKRPRERHKRWQVYLDLGATTTKEGARPNGRLGTSLGILGPVSVAGELEPAAPLPLKGTEPRVSGFLRYTF